MVFKSLSVNNFRNIDFATYKFHPLLTIIIGKNSVGKTNLLEAIYFIFNGKGLREEKQDDLIKWNSNQTRIIAHAADSNDITEYAINIIKIPAPKKIYQINKVKKFAKNYLEYCLSTVVFSPQLLNVIEGNPDRRRKHINNIISLYDKFYYAALNNYEKGLRKRNRILESNLDIFELQKQLSFWNEYLIKNGQYITLKRRQLIEFLNQNNMLKNIKFKAGYLENIINEQRLHDSFKLQMITKTTTVGPHRDDFEFYIIKNNHPVELKHFGSRSDERLCLFWLAVCELKLFNQMLSKKPILLLDDIFSELDISNKSFVIDLIKSYQTILTTTETDILTSINIPYSIIKL